MFELRQTDAFVKWFEGLRNIQVKGRIMARIERARMGNFGDWSPEGGEVRAMRIDTGPGYRLYYTIRDGTVLILLCGGDKRGQESDINRAHALLREV